MTDEQLRQALTAVTPQIMVEAVSEMLMLQRGRGLDIASPTSSSEHRRQHPQREQALTAKSGSKAALKQENMTITDLRRQIERNVIAFASSAGRSLWKIGISEDEARKCYDTHPEEFTTNASVTLREVLVSVPNDGKALNVGLTKRRQRGRAASRPGRGR